MSEKKGPSTAVIASTALPFILLVGVWVLTGGFDENPPYPPLMSRILPLALTAVAALTSFFAYNLAKDEEPEWGASLKQRLQFKATEGAALACVVLSLVFAVLILVTYFL